MSHFFTESTAGRSRLLASDREALERIRKLVRAAAEALRQSGRDESAEFHAQRQYAILMRCDLGPELHASVAQSLGLSLSQFYRERRIAREFVATYLTQSMRDGAQAATIHAVFDPYDFKIGRANALHAAGAYTAAIDLLRELIDHVGDPGRRLDVYCLLAQFCVEARFYPQAHIALQAARECCMTLTLSHTVNVDRLRGRFESANAKYHWAMGNIVDALDANTKAIHAFSAIRFQPGSDADALLAGAYIDLAHGLLSIGRFADARIATDEARRVISEIGSCAPGLRAQVLIAWGFVQINSLESMGDAAFTTLRAALAVAHQHSLGKEAIWAMAGLSLYAQFHGDIVAATAYIRDCLELGESMLTPFGLSNLRLRMLELEAISERPRDAIAHALAVRDEFPVESVGWNKSGLFSAMGSLEIADFATAQRMSQQIANVAARKNDARLYGGALRVYAAASAGLNRAGEARAAIEQAVEILETHGSPYNLLLTYETSSRITGNRRHALSAYELRSTAFRRLQLPKG